jgi:hypothetical protein
MLDASCCRGLPCATLSQQEASSRSSQASKTSTKRQVTFPDHTGTESRLQHPHRPLQRIKSAADDPACDCTSSNERPPDDSTGNSSALKSLQPHESTGGTPDAAAHNHACKSRLERGCGCIHSGHAVLHGLWKNKVGAG